MTVLVTGANGFVGSFLVEELLSRNYQVRCFVLAGEPLRWLKDLPVEIRYGNICQIETLYDTVEKVDCIYHLAGVKTAWDETTYFRVNFHGTKNVLEATLQRNYQLKRFVYVSSQAAAGPSLDGRPITEEITCQPITSYGKSKWAAEEYLQAYSSKVPLTILRPSFIYGPRNLETKLLYELIRWGIVPTIRHHDPYVNVIHVRDVVQAIILAAEHKQACGQLYFITSPERYTWREIIEQSLRIRNKKGRIFPIPWTGVKLAASMVKSYRKLRRQPFNLIDEKVEELRQKHWICNGQRPSGNWDLSLRSL
jgi:dihydroflavonol-4-reductase